MQLIIGSSIIPLDPGISLPLVLRSPLFVTDSGKIPGSYIFNTSFPATEALRKEFNQAHRPQRHGRATAELPYEISSGTLRYQGNCIITQADRDIYEVAFKLDNGDLASILAAKTLKDLDLGGDLPIQEVLSLAKEAELYIWSGINEGAWSETVHIIDTIVTDFTSSLSNSGNTFTSPGNYTITMVIDYDFILNNYLNDGYIVMSIKKNGTEIYSHNLNQGGFHEIIHDIALLTGDIITVDFTGYSSYLGVAYIWINSFSISYNSEYLFTTMALSGDGQESYDFAVFPILNASFLDNFPDDAFILDNLSLKTIYSQYFQVFNYYRNDGFSMFLSGYLNDENLMAANLFTPFIFMRTLLETIAEEAGYTIENDPFDEEFENAVLFNSYAENTYTSSDTKIIPSKLTFNLTDHVPSITQAEFLNMVTWFTGSVPFVDNNNKVISFKRIFNAHIQSEDNPAFAFPGIVLYLSKIKVEPEYKGIKLEMTAPNDSYVSDKVKAISDKMVFKGIIATTHDLPTSGNTVNDYYKVTYQNEYWVYQYDPTTYQLGWTFYSKDMALVYSEGVEPFLTITTALSPILSAYVADATPGAASSRWWSIPITKQAGILEGFPESLSAEYGTQILFYKGIQKDSLNADYPQGSSAFESKEASTQNANAKNIFTYRYKDFLQWLAYETKPATIQAILTQGQLQQLKLDRIYKGNGFNFLIKEVRVNLLFDSLSVAELDVYTC